jgi:hypothetical protein
MWGFEPLMTMSTSDIPVLHSAEVAPFTHKSCIPSSQGLQGLRHFRDEWLGIQYEAFTKFH